MTPLVRLSVQSAAGLFALLSGACVMGPPISEQDKVAAQTFTPPKGKALLYVYRPSGFIGSALTKDVVINGTNVGKNGTATFLLIPLKPGKYDIHASGVYRTSSSLSSGISLDAIPAKTYFIRQTVGMGSGSTMMLQTGGSPIPIALGGDFYFTAQVMDPTTGRADVSKCRQVGTLSSF